MRFTLKFKGNVYNLMRQLGYHPERKDEKTGELVFGRRIGIPDYPRFHVFIKINPVPQETVVNLHLDQKRPVYETAPAHAAEYSGEVLGKEVERIKQIAGL